MPKTRATQSAAVRRRRKKRVARRRTSSALQQTRAIEATLAGLAHDIRTPLTGILALGELLATSDLGEREKEWATAVKNTAEHLAALTSLIVDAAKADGNGLVLRHDPFSPRSLAEVVAVSLRARAQSRDLKAEVAVSKDLPDSAIGDGLRLRSAVENLIDNAVKFTERGGVRLDVTSGPAARGRLRLIFAVSDTGIGLSAAEIKRLFRPFAQANESIARRFGGAGLGLVFVKRLARAMGGDLTVESRGGGSQFRLSVVVDKIDKSANPAAQPSASGGFAGAPATRSLRILCAEDNPYGRVVLNTILNQLGHRVDFVGTGLAAVEMAARRGHDLVLMDVTLPGVDGLEATRRIRALARPAGVVPIIGISGWGTAEEEAAGRAAGMDAYIPKPISPAVLAKIIGTLTVSP
jgi:CheY-like chemotaxis protein/nitrogen-specific signal transduction histidine kinase